MWRNKKVNEDRANQSLNLTVPASLWSALGFSPIGNKAIPYPSLSHFRAVKAWRSENGRIQEIDVV